MQVNDLEFHCRWCYNKPMNNILVKFSKFKHLAKRDGFWSTLKSVSERLKRVLFIMLKWPKADIIFVSGLTGAVALYRNDYIAEELQEGGFKAGVLFESDPFLLAKLRRAKVIIVNRISWNSTGKNIFKQASKLNQKIIYDTDDLMFSEDLFKQSDAYCNFTEEEKKQYQDISGKQILKNKQLMAITTSTSFLAEKLKQFSKPVFVVKNKLSKQELRWTREARKIYLHRNRKDEDVRIGYFSGSISHNKDFATIIPALTIILNRYKNVKLYLVGYLDINSTFYRKFKKQIVQLPFVSRDKHYQNIAEVDINLAPLEMTEFCQSKSELKFFEAGIIGIPTIAVKNQTFSEVIINGKNGLLSGDVDDWINNMERLIDDKDLRIMLGEKARQTVLKKYLTDSGDNGEYYKFLKSLID